MTLPTVCVRVDDRLKPPQIDTWRSWLTALPAGCKQLLAHLYQGVIWGRREPTGDWVFSSDVDWMTLLGLRAFGPTCEVLVWGSVGQHRARLVEDIASGDHCYEALDDRQVLWGTAGVDLGNGFTQLSDGTQGLRHTVPITVPAETFKDGRRPVRLLLRHYIQPEPGTGLARVAISRLVAVSADSQYQE